MRLKVRLYLSGQMVEPSDYKNVQICCPSVDRIVNHIYEVNHMDNQLDLSDVEFEDEPAS